MTTFLIIVIVLIVVLLAKQKPQNKKPSTKDINKYNREPFTKTTERNTESVENKAKNTTITYNRPTTQSSKNNNNTYQRPQPGTTTVNISNASIVDVTDVNVKIDFGVDYRYGFNNDYEWGLGNRYKKELKLTDEQVNTLNKLIDTGNKFNSIEFCAHKLILLFFSATESLSVHFRSNGTSLEEEVSIIAHLELTKHYKFRKGSKNYNDAASAFTNTVNQVIYKICENSLRQHFSVGRKTDLVWYIHSADALNEFNMRIIPHVQQSVDSNLEKLEYPDEASEILLNEYNKARWKTGLQVLKDSFLPKDPRGFYEKVIALGEQNKRNPAVENIFFEASKHIAKYSKPFSLKLYAYYIHYDLISDFFDNKQITKTIQKSLFTNDQQLRDFETIINEFIQDRKLDKALDRIGEIYEPKRKKIKLDRSIIEEVQQQHSGTVELLNEYLKEDEVMEVVVSNEIESSTEISINLQYPLLEESTSLYKREIPLSEIQINTLSFFSKNGFSIGMEELNAFAKSNNVFRNSLIEGINDVCFEHLDDVLIEEEEDIYLINENYYQKILAQ